MTNNTQGAWDSYIQGTAGSGMETGMFPMNLDFAMDASGPGQQQQDPRSNMGMNSNNNNGFMDSQNTM